MRARPIDVPKRERINRILLRLGGSQAPKTQIHFNLVSNAKLDSTKESPKLKRR